MRPLMKTIICALLLLVSPAAAQTLPNLEKN
jgi:hypothetical protein